MGQALATSLDEAPTAGSSMPLCRSLTVRLPRIIQSWFPPLPLRERGEQELPNPNVRHLLPGLPIGDTAVALLPEIAPRDDRRCSIAPLQLVGKNEARAVLSRRKLPRTEDIKRWFARTFPAELRETIAQALAETWRT